MIKKKTSDITFRTFLLLPAADGGRFLFFNNFRTLFRLEVLQKHSPDEGIERAVFAALDF